MPATILPLLRRANGGIERLPSSSLPFGISPEAEFSSAFRGLSNRATLLILFTDGVVEAFNSAGEEFSDSRWINVIRALPKLSAQETLRPTHEERRGLRR